MSDLDTLRENIIQAAPPEPLGAAVIDGGAWYASVKLDAPMVKNYRQVVKVYGNRRDWFMTPETARSMADALLYFADAALLWRKENPDA